MSDSIQRNEGSSTYFSAGDFLIQYNRDAQLWIVNKYYPEIGDYSPVHFLVHIYSINHDVLVGENLSGQDVRVELDIVKEIKNV